LIALSVDEVADAQKLARANENLREQQRAISDVLRAVASSRGLQPVLDEILAATIRLCHGEHGQLYVADGDLLRIVAHIDRETARHQAGFEYGKAHPHAQDRTTVVGRVALSGEPVQIPDVLADPEYTHGAQQFVGFRALLGVPVVLDGELIGAMAIARDTPGPFVDDEVELVKTFADQAAVAIANARLIEAVERQRTELSRFLSPQVAELISSPEGEQLLAGHRAYITCLFCDLRGFTAFAETADPEELFEVLRAYHETLGELIRTHGGTLEHFAGDGVMVFFNDPVPFEQHEFQAIRLALAAQGRIGELAQTWRKRGIQLGLGIGIEAGYATLGRIGFEGRYDYGALGPVANLASRLSTNAQAGQILIGQRVYAAAEEAIDAAPVGDLELKGFGRPIFAYEVRALRGS
jgi:class 3 adenylate cyclase